MATTPAFAHLHVHSPFSFLDGTSRIDVLLEEAAILEMPAMALTDHNNVSGAVRFQKKALEKGIQPIQGAEVTLAGGYHLTLLATGPQGYGQLNRIITAAHLGRELQPQLGAMLELAPHHDRLQPAAPLAALSHNNDGLIALSGCRKGEIPSLILRGRYAEAVTAARRYATWFPGRFYLELQDGRQPGERALNLALRELGESLDLPLVATANVHYRTREEFFVHDLLTCVRTLTRLDQPHPERPLNAEQYLKSPAAMAGRFREFPEAVANTLRIAERCSPALDLNVRLFPEFATPNGSYATAFLTRLVYDGAVRRYGRVTAKVRSRLDYELAIITRLGYEDYFLLVWDVVRFARERSIRCAGRGSAADSAVAYCLFITDVDAIGRGLLFERFMSLERAEKPDIDIDFDARRRDEVAAYVYRKYGADRVASVCTFNTFQARSAVRDLGKAMGFQEGEIDYLAKRIPWHAGADDILEVMGRFPELRQTQIPWHKFEQLIKAAAQVARLPRFMGTHLGGLVISRHPLLEVTPLQVAAKGQVICQFDKEYVEDLGLVKLDLLSLRTLSAVDDAVRMMGAFDYDRIPADDKETYRMLGTGETVGVFQLESPAQRALQARLGADRFEDLVASVAIIRPGPIQGNMVEPFLARRRGQEEITYLHPKLEPILAKTYGVVLFQEQVIEIATAVAGFTPGEADQLRRVMTHARHKEDMLAIGRLFSEKAAQQGVEPAVAETIFSYIQGYASYGFCEAHAAAFANTAYKTAYLVQHHPAEYFAALMSAQPMGYYPINTLAGEARRHGVGLLPVDMNRSESDFTVEEWSPEAWAAFWGTGGWAPAYPPLGKAIRIGLKAVKGVGAPTITAALEGRGPAGYRSLEAFIQQTRGTVARDGLEALILTGAFDALHPNRRQLLWQVSHLLERERSRQVGGLVQGAVKQGELEQPAAAPPVIDDFTPEERYLKEYELTGLMVRDHFMRFARDRLKSERYLTAAEAKRAQGGELVRVAGLPIRPHRPPTKSGRIVVFLSLEDETGLIDLTIFEDVYQRYGHLIFTDPRPPLAALGRVDRRGGHVAVTVTRLKAL